MVNILHISDIHAGSPEFDACTYRFDQTLHKILEMKDINYLVCSGDLTFQGEKKEYLKVITFFENIAKHPIDIILVPGNHDICSGEEPFASFDAAANKINEKISHRFSADSCCVYSTTEIDFFLVNSAYLGEYTYGKIDITPINKLIESLSSGKIRILIAHHPFLAGTDDKRSSVVNSREILQCLAENEFKAILHGHQHMNTRFGFKFKENIVDVIGVRSLSLPSTAIPIGAQLISISDSDILVEQIDLSTDKGMTW